MTCKVFIVQLAYCSGLGVLLIACTTGSAVKLTPFQLASIDLHAAPDMNDHNPVAVDIVFTDDKEILRDLEGFAASGWFTVKKTELPDWKDHIRVVSLVIPPGQKIGLTEFPEGYEKALGIVVYANYETAGLHRLVFVKVNHIKLNLLRQSIEAQGGKPYLLTSAPDPIRNDQSRRY